MRDSLKPDPVPELYTVIEVENYLLSLLVLSYARQIDSEELVRRLKLARYDCRSFSSNTIQGTYFGKRLDVHVLYIMLRKLAREASAKTVSTALS